MELLKLEKVSVAYQGKNVLQNISFSVPVHTATVFIGASGSGKSTLLRCINLLDSVDDGVVKIDGEDITDPTIKSDQVRRKLGMVFQAFNLFPHMTVRQNITLAPIQVHGLSKDEAKVEHKSETKRN